MPGERDLLDEFMSELNPKELGELVRFVFERMRLAGEAGSLLKIEEDVRDKIKELRRKVGPLFARGDFWDNAEREVLKALKVYSERAGNGGATRRRLFADDAAQGFAFIDLCLKKYDVVLMNPPFGEVSDSASVYIERLFPTWNKNMLCAFIERGWQLSAPSGAVGAIYDRTAVIKSTYEDFRRSVLVPDNRMVAMADLGWGVLEANVDVTTSVLQHLRAWDVGAFIDARPIPVDDKGEYLLSKVQNLLRTRK